MVLHVLIQNLIKILLKCRWDLPPKEWLKINVDASTPQGPKPASIMFIMRNNSANVIMAKDTIIEDCCILVDDCLAIQKDIYRIIITIILRSLLTL